MKLFYFILFYFILFFKVYEIEKRVKLKKEEGRCQLPTENYLPPFSHHSLEGEICNNKGSSTNTLPILFNSVTFCLPSPPLSPSSANPLRPSIPFLGFLFLFPSSPRNPTFRRPPFFLSRFFSLSLSLSLSLSFPLFGCRENSGKDNKQGNFQVWNFSCFFIWVFSVQPKRCFFFWC